MWSRGKPLALEQRHGQRPVGPAGWPPSSRPGLPRRRRRPARSPPGLDGRLGRRRVELLVRGRVDLEGAGQVELLGHLAAGGDDLFAHEAQASASRRRGPSRRRRPRRRSSPGAGTRAPCGSWDDRLRRAADDGHLLDLLLVRAVDVGGLDRAAGVDAVPAARRGRERADGGQELVRDVRPGKVLDGVPDVPWLPSRNGLLGPSTYLRPACSASSSVSSTCTLNR